MKMIRNNLLVKRLTKEQLGKIVLPQNVEDEWARGRVIALGRDVVEDIKLDDIVLFPPKTYGGDYPTVGVEGCIIIPDNIVWAIE